MPYGRTLLIIHFKYTGVFMSIPNSLTIPSPGGLPDPGIELESPALQVDFSPAKLSD